MARDCGKGPPLLASALRSLVPGAAEKGALGAAHKAAPPTLALLETFKQLAASKKHRQRLNSFLVPGLVCIKSCPVERMQSVLACSEDALRKLEGLVKLPPFVPVALISDSQYFALTNEHNPCGVVAKVEMVKMERFNGNPSTGSPKQRWIGVNGIRDGANLGLLIRTVGCLGWNGVIIIGPGSVDPFCFSTVRASAGTIFSVPLYFVDSFQELSHMQLVLAETPDKASLEQRVDWDQPLVLVLGNEQSGHPAVPDRCFHMTIPVQAGFGSLNVAIAGGILMSRINYDNDVTVFSPQGRLFQVEYAQEAVKQGAPCVGLASSRHAVLAGLKRSPGDLSASATRKLFALGPHVGCGIAGLTSDARVLTKAMQKEVQGRLLSLEEALSVSRLVNKVACERAQQSTQYYGGRPFGVGLLVAGVDSTGPHLYEFNPSGSCTEYTAWAIGARAQSARTYLEGRYDEHPEGGVDEESPFAEASLEDMVRHALTALRECLPPDQSLTAGNASVGIVTVDADFRICTDAEVGVFLDKLPPQARRAGQAPHEEEGRDKDLSADEPMAAAGDRPMAD